MLLIIENHVTLCHYSNQLQNVGYS